MGTTKLAMSLGERIAYAGRMTLIGMVTVFAALAILWGCLALFRLLIAAGEKRSAAKAAQQAPVTAPAAPATPVAPATNEGETVAAITAAISLVLAAENGGVTPNFRVVSYRRSGGRSK
ncbi:MAG: OadG family protein [Clostridia bacterium]|nr:OadG family protein [Clostridia bacterium]